MKISVVDDLTIETILLREEGRINTFVACLMLGLGITALLKLRRELLERATGLKPLPPLTFTQVENALRPNRRAAPSTTASSLHHFGQC